jgi:hypothetical protein
MHPHGGKQAGDRPGQDLNGAAHGLDHRNGSSAAITTTTTTSSTTTLIKTVTATREAEHPQANGPEEDACDDEETPTTTTVEVTVFHTITVTADSAVETAAWSGTGPDGPPANAMENPEQEAGAWDNDNDTPPTDTVAPVNSQPVTTPDVEAPEPEGASVSPAMPSMAPSPGMHHKDHKVHKVHKIHKFHKGHKGHNTTAPKPASPSQSGSGAWSYSPPNANNTVAAPQSLSASVQMPASSSVPSDVASSVSYAAASVTSAPAQSWGTDSYPSGAWGPSSSSAADVTSVMVSVVVVQPVPVSAAP